MRTRRLALLLGLLAAVLPASAGPDTGPVRPDPRDLHELRLRFAPLPGRLAALFERAEKDPRFARVELYASYKPVHFEDKKREVRAKELLAILKDASAPFDLRLEVVKALTGPIPKTFDKDLEVGRGSKSPRNDLSMQYVWPMLDADDDLQGHQLAHDYLIGMHGQQTDADILGYKAREARTWKSAKNAWRRILK